MTSNHWQRLAILMQARVTDQTAFILRRREWRNTSLILDLFTLDYGCITVLAKGARNSAAKSRYQPFVPLQVSWSGMQDLKTLTGIESINWSVEEQNYLALLYINELVLSFVPKSESTPEIFNAYLALIKLAESKLETASLRRFEFELIDVLGYFPDISVEANTSEPIKPEGHYQFVIDLGFVECIASAENAVKGSVVIEWINDNYDQNDVQRLAKSVLSSTIDFNLHGKRLKSRDVSRDILRSP